MIKPARILSLLIYIACMVGLVMLFSPREIAITEEWSIKIFTFEDLLPKPSTRVDMSAVEELQSTIDSLEKGELLSPKSEAAGNKAALQFPEGKEDVLSGFFQALKGEVDTSLVRIVHYGDSQIEGDRITEYLRNRLQKRFGGCGVGMVPPTEIEGIRTTTQFEATKNFVRYEVFGPAKKISLHQDYGYLGNYHKFAYQTPEMGDSAREVRGELVFSRPLLKTYDRIYRVEKVSVAYRNRNQPLQLRANWRGKQSSQKLRKSQGFGLWEMPVEGKLSKFQLELLSKGDPEVYGVAFDCQTGIALDNAPFRGSSGTEFTAMNRKVLREQIRKMNIKLMILQFGVNVVPYVRKEYGYHKRAMKKQLDFLKSLSPELEIIVIGPSDMARKQGTEFASYQNIPALRDALRDAAFESDCAFWDLYEAMGGANSIIGWVDSNPAFANPDHTHFTRKGAKLVGEMFYKSLMSAYRDWQKGE